ncbi:MAG: twin-arginine translocase TatA/TatE family subunit [Bifidobacteriaceae bacterium]|jgi:sec-independent protein translocase protein TatA|nr:twin-arginine translocase TatA/TatE family subunit [Bifidobacteriaceae bacterium]
MFRNGLQPSHVILILVVVLLLVGSTKLPALAKSLGQSLKIFKKEVEGLTSKDEDAGSGAAGMGGSAIGGGGGPGEGPNGGAGPVDQTPESPTDAPG